MTQSTDGGSSVVAIWERARAGDLRGANDAARRALDDCIDGDPSRLVELNLVRACCFMRQGSHAKAQRSLDAAAHHASSENACAHALRVGAWRAELAYFQGRYSDANDIIDRILPPLEKRGDLAYVAFVLRVRIAILLARADYKAITALTDRAIRTAEASADDYVIVQILNILGASHFDRATSKLSGPHARAHLTALDPDDTSAMESDARQALQLFERARAVAERAHYEFAAWYVAGNIERLQIILGNAEGAVLAIRKRLVRLQARGAKYDEIVTRSNLAWGLRTLGRYQEALHELEVALVLARETGTFNVLHEFLEYDRSIVLDALGDRAAARASYRRYLQLVGAGSRAGETTNAAPPLGERRPLEPNLLKRADRFVLDHIGEPFAIARLAEHCGVSLRMLENVFAKFRGITPVAHIRNMRLDHARFALSAAGGSVAEIAARYGFRSPTTFTLEYRKRFGVPPSRARRARAA